MNAQGRAHAPPGVAGVLGGIAVVGLGVGVAYVASVHPFSGESWFERLVQGIPGLTQGPCQDLTLFARLIPPLLVFAGVGLTFVGRSTARVLWILRGTCVVIAAVLVYLVTKNAHFGELGCIPG